MWLNATYELLGRNESSYGESLAIPTLIVSAQQTLKTGRRLFRPLLDWKCENVYEADVALYRLLKSWYELAVWQSSTNYLDKGWEEAYLYGLRLSSLAAARMTARTIRDTHDSEAEWWNQVWVLSPEQEALNALWDSLVYEISRRLTTLGWSAIWLPASLIHLAMDLP
jgi:hypothetical protein